eukprot:gene11333-21119_t
MAQRTRLSYARTFAFRELLRAVTVLPAGVMAKYTSQQRSAASLSTPPNIAGWSCKRHTTQIVYDFPLPILLELRHYRQNHAVAGRTRWMYANRADVERECPHAIALTRKTYCTFRFARWCDHRMRHGTNWCNLRTAVFDAWCDRLYELAEERHIHIDTFRDVLAFTPSKHLLSRVTIAMISCFVDRMWEEHIDIVLRLDWAGIRVDGEFGMAARIRAP